jgi:hypothetical protein
MVSYSATQAEMKIASTTARPVIFSARKLRRKQAIPRGTAVRASPKLCTRSARGATEFEKTKIASGATAVRPRIARLSPTALTPSRERRSSGRRGRANGRDLGRGGDRDHGSGLRCDAHRRPFLRAAPSCAARAPGDDAAPHIRGCELDARDGVAQPQTTALWPQGSSRPAPLPKRAPPRPPSPLSTSRDTRRRASC